MRRILVTAISGDIGNGILKILKQSQNCVLLGCDVNDIAVGMDMVSVFWKCKYATEDGYIEELLDKCTLHHITHLIPVNEREIEIISKFRYAFTALNIRLVIQSDELLQICLDKYNTAMFLQKHGFQTPTTYSTPDQLPENSGRYICKPRKSNGSKNIFLFEKKEDLYQTDLENCIFQNYIDSTNEYTIGVFRHNNLINILAFKRELKNGYSNKVELVHDTGLYDLAEQLALAFSLDGYFNIQLREKDGVYFIFEINPRISGTVRFRDMLGFHDVLWWLDLLDAKKPTQYVCPYSCAVGVRELNEKFLILKDKKKEHTNESSFSNRMDTGNR